MEETKLNQPDAVQDPQPSGRVPTASRDEDVDAPQSRPEKGPMDQTVPDVATGSTPVTRHDD